MNLDVDAGPIIALSKVGHLDLLPRLFDKVIVSLAVCQDSLEMSPVLTR